MPEQFRFKTYAWSLGTTSFRMADFHKKVEEQLLLIQDFWHSQPADSTWSRNKGIQEKYYDFLYEHKFITGQIAEAEKKSKTARQKTSALVSIGLIDEDRKLTNVGKKLLDIVKSGDFSSDNEFQIPKDSFIYLKQIIKTSCDTALGTVRPFSVLGKLLIECDGYLSDDEFTYLLPLCTDKSTTDSIIKNISSLRSGQTCIENIIRDIVLSRYEYPRAKEYFIQSPKNGDVIMTIGMNRDGKKQDKNYVELYNALKGVYIEHRQPIVADLYYITRKFNPKIASFWNKLLFKTNKRNPVNFADLEKNAFDNIKNEADFAACFFDCLHLIKIKALLSDYKDLNRRYFKITDAFMFGDNKVEFAPIFKYYFAGQPKSLFEDLYTKCCELTNDVPLNAINNNLVFDKDSILSLFNQSNSTDLTTLDELYANIKQDRYRRFKDLINSKFTNDIIIAMIPKFIDRLHDKEIRETVGCDADIPTIFEYIIGIAWYRISEYQGNILDYMKLSLDMDLLPRTHACGGVSDIVYDYAKTTSYHKHTLLIECTLLEGINARRSEMEPVSRHLANYMIDKDPSAYCTFISNDLHPSVISDFRSRKSIRWYRNSTEFAEDLKIIPLHINDLKLLLEKGIKYSQIYNLFMTACDSDIKDPPAWYRTCIQDPIKSMH